MSRVFRRRKKADQEGTEGVDDVVDTDEAHDEDEDEPDAGPAVPERPQGPWDVDDAPEDDLQRIDLGGMRVPVPPGTEVRVDVNSEGEVVAATLVQGPSSMQVNAFAAPRTSGIWTEVRTEIAAALQGTGGRTAEAEGRYGTELRALVPVQGGGAAPARFLGVDGPRWFVRALITGPAARDLALAAPLEEALRGFVVVRGTEAMAVRDPLPLRLPREVVEQAAAAQAGARPGGAPAAGGEPGPEAAPGAPGAGAPGAGAGADPLRLPERGPEITERR